MLTKWLWIVPWLFVLMVWLRIGADHSRKANYVIRGFGLWPTSSILTSWEGRKSWRLSLITWAIIQWSCLHNETLIKSLDTGAHTGFSGDWYPVRVAPLGVLGGRFSRLPRERTLEISYLSVCVYGWDGTSQATPMSLLFADPNWPDLYPFWCNKTNFKYSAFLNFNLV